MAITQAQIDALEQAFVDRKGAIEIEFDNQKIRFDTLANMRNFIADLKQQLATQQLADATTTPSTLAGLAVGYAVVDKGV